MLVIVGILLVFGAIATGYLLEKGNLLVLLQPAELIIIGGAAIGTLLTANPIHLLKEIFQGMLGTLKGSKYTKPYFGETLKMLYDLFAHVRKVGVAAVEQDVDEPEKSQVFSKYPKFLTDHTALHFLCDTFRTYTSGAVGHMDIDHLMETEIEVLQEELHRPVQALHTVADCLPGLGIVAAVLGVVITMGSLGGPPEEVGQKVAAALVGTFLGILLCYGVVGPLANNMAVSREDEILYYRCLREGVNSFVKGAAPMLAVEFARRTIPDHLRPSFQEMETLCRGTGAP